MLKEENNSDSDSNSNSDEAILKPIIPTQTNTLLAFKFNSNKFNSVKKNAKTSENYPKCQIKENSISDECKTFFSKTLVLLSNQHSKYSGLNLENPNFNYTNCLSNYNLKNYIQEENNPHNNISYQSFAKAKAIKKIKRTATFILKSLYEKFIRNSLTINQKSLKSTFVDSFNFHESDSSLLENNDDKKIALNSKKDLLESKTCTQGYFVSSRLQKNAGLLNDINLEDKSSCFKTKLNNEIIKKETNLDNIPLRERSFGCDLQMINSDGSFNVPKNSKFVTTDQGEHELDQYNNQNKGNIKSKAGINKRIDFKHLNNFIFVLLNRVCKMKKF